MKEIIIIMPRPSKGGVKGIGGTINLIGVPPDFTEEQAVEILNNLIEDGQISFGIRDTETGICTF